MAHLHVGHLIIHLLHGDAAAEDASYGEVAAVLGVTSRHHVPGIEHLGGQLGHGEGAEGGAAAGGQRGEAGHEEVEAREGNHVDRQLAQVSVQLAGEPEGGGHPGHRERDQVVKIAVGWVGQLESPK